MSNTNVIYCGIVTQEKEGAKVNSNLPRHVYSIDPRRKRKTKQETDRKDNVKQRERRYRKEIKRLLDRNKETRKQRSPNQEIELGNRGKVERVKVQVSDRKTER